jgi:NADPH:quinone reductase-like Zn-dependent oxidoreductase
MFMIVFVHSLLIFAFVIVNMSEQVIQREANQKMKAVLASKFGNPDDVLTVADGVDKPEPDEKSLIIKVHACSLSPGDYRALLGQKTIVANPKTWPYIPGGDVCGTLEYVPKALADEYRVGEKVVATWHMYGKGGLAQYHKVDPKVEFTVKLPEGVAVDEGAALANTASHALLILERAKIKEGDRVLVLGGSGGLGTLLVQMLKKNKGASYVGTTSTDTSLMKKLGVDLCVDYTKENFWEVKDWQQNKFDCVIDAAVGEAAFKKCPPVVKSCRQGGRYLGAILQEWYIDGTTWMVMFHMLFPPLVRRLFNLFRWSTPYYNFYIGVPTKETMARVLAMAANKEFNTILDPESPHPFTTEGVRKAWNKHIARKGHGKIVISVD